MFDFDKAFSRNIGWITRQEQQVLRTKTVAIAGAGGVGGEHLVTLARLGIQRFKLADFDEFELHNFNRQAGAFMSTLNQEKCSVLKEICLDINPEAALEIYEDGVHAANVDAFLKDADIYVDGLDFFALNARKLVFQKCLEKHIPIVTCAPMGMGASLLCFMPGKMTYEEYFQFESVQSEQEQLLKFLIGLSPNMLQRDYLVDAEASDFMARKGPSTPMSVKLCSGLLGTYVLKILLNRGKVLCAPWSLHFDAYKNKMKRTYRPFGNANPIQRLMFKIAKSAVLK